VSNYRVASAYAKSLLEFAKESKKVEAVHKDVEFIHATLSSSRELVLTLKSPVILNTKKLSILEAVFKEKISEITLKFFILLVKKGREDILVDVSKEFLNQYKLSKGILSGTVVTAIKADDVLKTKIESLTKKITKSKVDIQYKVDAGIIGGFILTIGDKQIDQSVKSHLNSLRNQFSNNPYIPKY
jgi:F-type H+-transporting ATPase subunit delta